MASIRQTFPWSLLAIALMIFFPGAPLSAVAAAGKTDKVILGSGLGPPYIWYMTAVDNGIMKKHGVNADYKIFPSGVEAIIAVGAGEAHVSNGSCSTPVWCTSGTGWDGPTGVGTPAGVGAF